MRRELAKYFKEVMEPLTHEDKELLRKAGIKERPFFKSTKGGNCVVVYAYQARERVVLKFKTKSSPLFDQKTVNVLVKNGIGVVDFYGIKQLPKGTFYGKTEAAYYEMKAWAGYDFEISLKASIAAMKSTGFRMDTDRAKTAMKLIASDMHDAGYLAGSLFRAELLYTDFKPANVAKTTRVQLFDLHTGLEGHERSIQPSNSVAKHSESALFYLDNVYHTIKDDANSHLEPLWSYAKDYFIQGVSKANGTKPLIAAINRGIW